MAFSFVELLHSRTFTFLVGSEETPVVVHSAAIAKLSQPLERLINGPMKEAEENYARLVELEIEDFERICEFAYRGDYVSPSWIDSTSDEHGNDDTSEDIGEELSMSDSAGGESNDYAIPKERKALVMMSGLGRLCTHFRKSKYMTGKVPRLVIARDFKPAVNFSSAQDFTPVFLGYARLYAFAEHYMAHELKELTLYKLHWTLNKFMLFKGCRPAVVKLARSAYDAETIPDRGVHGEMDKLRQLVVEYIAMNIRDFKGCADHRRFLNEEGEYAGDLLDILEKWRL